MAYVDININGRVYRLSCADDEAENVKKIGLHLNRMAIDITSGVGQVQESLLLVMLAVLAKDDALRLQAKEEKTDQSIISLLEKITRLAKKIEKR